MTRPTCPQQPIETAPWTSAPPQKLQVHRSGVKALRRDVELRKAEPERLAEHRRHQAELAQLMSEGQRLRATAKRLRLDCTRARVDLAERLADLASQNRNHRKLFRLYADTALQAYRHICALISTPGWTGMDRQALQPRLEKIRTALETMETSMPSSGRAEGPAFERGGKKILDENCVDELTNRERQVLKCVAEGYSTKEVASVLGITFKTASCHRQHIMSKLGVHDAPTLVRYAIRMRLVEP